MEELGLVKLLKKQHRELQGDLGLVKLDLLLPEGEREKQVVVHLAKFKQDLLEHLKLEDRVFYKDYLEKRRKLGGSEGEVTQFMEEMKSIGKVVMEFLDKYAESDAVARSIGTFPKELGIIAATLNARVETEEEGVYDFYLAM